MIAGKLDEGGGIGLPVHRKTLEILEHRPQAGGAEYFHRVFGIFIEVGVENALIHEIGVPLDGEEHPAQVMQLQDGQGVGLRGDRFLDGFGVFIEDVFPAWDDLRQDREAVASRRLREDRPVTPLLDLVLEIPSLWDRHCGRLRPVLRLGFARHVLALLDVFPQWMNLLGWDGPVTGGGRAAGKNRRARRLKGPRNKAYGTSASKVAVKRSSSG